MRRLLKKKLDFMGIVPIRESDSPKYGISSSEFIVFGRLNWAALLKDSFPLYGTIQMKSRFLDVMASPSMLLLSVQWVSEYVNGR